eukprot:GHVR01097225.1.p1 GENE.GHVR01097225.1~~GHVR01097225.1.p1  ORF type:complete len:101 (+),score=2.13 GHVR01097225.1:101-403(+)
MIPALTGLVISGIIATILPLFRVRKLAPIRLGRYPTSSMTFLTLFRVFLDTMSGALNTRDTVAGDTFANAAMSFIPKVATKKFPKNYQHERVTCKSISIH